MMYDKTLAKFVNNPQVCKIGLAMDIVADHYKDYNEVTKSYAFEALEKYAYALSCRYSPEDSTIMLTHEELIDLFYDALEVKGIKNGDKCYFVDFIGMFNMNIYEHCTYWRIDSEAFDTEVVTDLFNKKIADFYIPSKSIGHAHIFTNKTDCDVFCYFVDTLNNNLLGVR